MFRLEFDTDNDAFTYPSDAPAVPEIVRILDNVAWFVDSGRESGKIKDINGNTIGSWEWEN